MANKYNLSEGALEVIMKGGDYKQPIVQVLGIKKIQANSVDKERYRMLLSDGKVIIKHAMLTSQINDTAYSGEITDYSVIRIERYITSVINNSGNNDTRVLLILDVKTIVPGEQIGKRIGNPTAYGEGETTGTLASNGTSATSSGTSATRNGTSLFNGSTTTANKSVMKPSSSSTTISNGPDLSNQLTHPISSLSPYHNKWIIKARVTSKSNVRSWANSKGEGKLFSMDLVDESGEIRLTGFREMVDKYFEYIEVDKVYYITKCQLKPANKQFSNLKNDYEMTMTSETIIQRCPDEDDTTSIPKTQYDFVQIDRIANIEPNSFIDVIGVVKSVGELLTFQAKSTGKELKKKEVTLVDQSNTAITLTLWGAEAENFDGSNNPVLVIKSVRVGEFGGGKNLGCVSTTSIKINPDIKECYCIRGWYDNGGSSLDSTNISARSGSGNFSAQWLSFKEVQDQGLGHAEKGDYYQVMGTVLLIRSENAFYKACPTDECNKKVIDLENGMYRCEKCNREFPNFKYRLLASMNVGDWSGNQWISMFSSEVEKILGASAEEVGRQVEENSAAMTNITDKAHFKQFIMKCRAKMETYNDEARLKTVCVKVEPINYEEYNAHLIDRIQQLLS